MLSTTVGATAHPSRAAETTDRILAAIRQQARREASEMRMFLYRCGADDEPCESFLSSVCSTWKAAAALSEHDWKLLETPGAVPGLSKGALCALRNEVKQHVDAVSPLLFVDAPSATGNNGGPADREPAVAAAAAAAPGNKRTRDDASLPDESSNDPVTGDAPPSGSNDNSDTTAADLPEDDCGIDEEQLERLLAAEEKRAEREEKRRRRNTSTEENQTGSSDPSIFVFPASFFEDSDVSVASTRSSSKQGEAVPFLSAHPSPLLSTSTPPQVPKNKKSVKKTKKKMTVAKLRRLKEKRTEKAKKKARRAQTPRQCLVDECGRWFTTAGGLVWHGHCIHRLPLPKELAGISDTVAAAELPVPKTKKRCRSVFKQQKKQKKQKKTPRKRSVATGEGSLDAVVRLALDHTMPPSSNAVVPQHAQAGEEPSSPPPALALSHILAQLRSSNP